MTAKLTREPELYTIECATVADAIALGQGIVDAIQAHPDDDDPAIGEAVAGLRVEVRGTFVTLGGDLRLAEDSIQVALDIDPELPDVEGLWTA